ncbi:DUF5994 family protein [Actinoplanes sp. M2I2]|uniref:DUF5994 family protein n=1 Tax=Actinoplanes sp. M2I2 TaxID=1734444 RepID=UPI00202280B0|nr:DUF5994 family protein [Actinoplanes sp. M2I2]
MELEPAGNHHLLHDGGWWPAPQDLGAKLRSLMPALDQVRGPVARLLLGAAGWTTRPHQVVLADRTVSLGYLADQPPSMITVRCVDGGTFVLRIAPSFSR